MGVGESPRGTIAKGLFACSCRGRFDAWLISAWQFRYNMPNAVEMRKVKENIEMGDKNSNTNATKSFFAQEIIYGLF